VVASRGGGEGELAAANGAPLIHWLLEEEVTRWPFDEGELKRGDGALFSFSIWRWRSMDGGTVMQVTRRRRRLGCARRKETQVELGLQMGRRPKASGPAWVEKGGLLEGFWA
jgi:hypothetical protein